MRNPLEDEATAFRFVLGTIVYLALIVLASWLAPFFGVVMFATLTLVALAMLRGGAFNRTWGNRLMRLRVAIQFIAILIMMGAMYFSNI